MPLVLPKDAFNEHLRYAGGVWQSSYCENVPFLDERPLAGPDLAQSASREISLSRGERFSAALSDPAALCHRRTRGSLTAIMRCGRG